MHERAHLAQQVAHDAAESRADLRGREERRAEHVSQPTQRVRPQPLQQLPPHLPRAWGQGSGLRVRERCCTSIPREAAWFGFGFGFRFGPSKAYLGKQPPLQLVEGGAQRGAGLVEPRLRLAG